MNYAVTGNVEDYTFTLYRTNGSAEILEPTNNSANGRYAVNILDNAAVFFAYDYVIRVTNNETGEYNEVSSSVYAFLQIKMKNSSTSPELYKLCQAIYYYCEVASAYCKK